MQILVSLLFLLFLSLVLQGLVLLRTLSQYFLKADKKDRALFFVNSRAGFCHSTVVHPEGETVK